MPHNAEKNQMSVDFSNIFHEMEKPLENIFKMAEQLEKNPKADEHKKISENLIASGNSIKELLEKMNSLYMNMDFSIVVREDTYKMTTLISSVYSAVSSRAAERKIKPVLCINPTLPVYLKGDYSKIRHILLNIADMSVKLFEDGTITMSIDWNGEVNNPVIVFGLKIKATKKIQDKFSETFFSDDVLIRHYVENIGGSISVNDDADEKICAFTIEQKLDDYVPIGEDVAEVIIENSRYNITEDKLVFVDSYDNVININEGIKYVSENMDEYLNILHVIYQDYLEKKEYVDDITKIKNIEKYTNTLISFKSISKFIGADKLTRIIRANEYAYSNNDYDFIRNNMPVAVAVYTEAMQEVRTILMKNGRSVELSEPEIPKFVYTSVGEALMRVTCYIDNFDVKSARREMEKLIESDETDWIKKQVISRGLNMLSSCCYNDVKNLAVALAEGEKL